MVLVAKTYKSLLGISKDVCTVARDKVNYAQICINHNDKNYFQDVMSF